MQASKILFYFINQWKIFNDPVLDQVKMKIYSLLSHDDYYIYNYFNFSRMIITGQDAVKCALLTACTDSWVYEN